MKKYIKSAESANSDLQEAIDLLNQYSWREFDKDYEITTNDDLSNIGIMYTMADETDDNYKQLQVTVDLINPSIKYYVIEQIIDAWLKDTRY